VHVFCRNSTLQDSHEADNDSILFVNFSDLSFKILIGHQFENQHLYFKFDQHLCIFSENDIVNNGDVFDPDADAERSDFKDVLFEYGILDCSVEVASILLGWEIDVLLDLV